MNLMNLLMDLMDLLMDLAGLSTCSIYVVIYK